MESEIEEAILALAQKIYGNTADENFAMKASQAILNLAHSLQVLKQNENVGRSIGDMMANAQQRALGTF